MPVSYTGQGTHPVLPDQDQTPKPWEDWLYSDLLQLRRLNLTRHLRPVVPSASAVEATLRYTDLQCWARGEEPPGANAQDERVQDQVVSIRLFSLNDYLGLSTHPGVSQAVSHAAVLTGNGPRSSALIGGFTTTHRELECALAALKGTEDCLLFPSGYAANTATLATLANGPDCAIFSDALNHASIIDGCRLAARSGAHLKVYRHCDLQHLERHLQGSQHRRKLVVTDSLFSMDGDFADLKALVNLKTKYHFLLVIDEAHATLVCGTRGGGAAEAAGVSADVDVHVGTLSKAAGSHGGFVACSSRMRAALVNHGRPFVFSTSLPVPVVAGALAAIRIACTEEAWRRHHVAMLTQRLAKHLGIIAHSPIIPVIVGSEQRAMAASAALLLRGFHVPAIRPPTVPAGTSRLRISLSAAHTTEDIDGLARAITETLQELGTEDAPIAKL